jgi:uncharacterized iron-regulated membrane protein
VSTLTPAFLRKWHRWIAFPAAAFLLFAAVTGVITAMTEFFGEAEALREATRTMTSPVHTDSPLSDLERPLARALAAAATAAPGAPIDRIQLQFKGPRPAVDVFLGRPGGGEDRRLVFDAQSGTLLRTDSYVDKPLIHRIHSGEAFGDGGLVFAMFWGMGLALLTISGVWIYFTMRRRNATGLKKVFW